MSIWRVFRLCQTIGIVRRIAKLSLKGTLPLIVTPSLKREANYLFTIMSVCLAVDSWGLPESVLCRLAWYIFGPFSSHFSSFDLSSSISSSTSSFPFSLFIYLFNNFFIPLSNSLFVSPYIFLSTSSFLFIYLFFYQFFVLSSVQIGLDTFSGIHLANHLNL